MEKRNRPSPVQLINHRIELMPTIQTTLSRLQREVAYIRENIQQEVGKRISGVFVDVDALETSDISSSWTLTGFAYADCP